MIPDIQMWCVAIVWEMFELPPLPPDLFAVRWIFSFTSAGNSWPYSEGAVCLTSTRTEE